MGLVFDPLFFDPFLTGCALSVTLPAFGMYLRLRDEWLAALAFAQISALGALLAMLWHLPLMIGGMGAAALAAALKRVYEGTARKTQGTAYVLLFLLGWGASILLIANLPIAERIGQALFEGQLYFTGRAHRISVMVLSGVALVVLYFISRPLLLSHFFPDFFRARGSALSERYRHALFDLASALVLALAAMSVGVMAAFALIFIPPFIAFEWGVNWRRSIFIALVSGMLAHVTAFGLALAFDQPYGPLLVILLVTLGSASRMLRRFCSCG